MHRFEEARDPLSERVSDAELREVLKRLGEAQFGGDERATVGAIVEATGVDAATVLRLLGEVRQKEIDAQRRFIEGLERRVLRLEAPPVPARPRPEIRDREGFAWTTVAAFAIPVLALFAYLGFARAQTVARDPVPETRYARTHDGQIVLAPNGGIEVVRNDGTSRSATDEEAAEVRTNGTRDPGR